MIIKKFWQRSNPRRVRPSFCPLLETLEDRTLPANFFVLNTNDEGFGSLRQAIQDANANLGADTITFAIPGSGVHTINVGSATGQPLPAITQPILIDGWSQGVFSGTPGYQGPPLIELNGLAAGEHANGLVINAPGSTVRGLVINRFADSGLTFNFDQGIAVGNYIGTNAQGDESLPNGGFGLVLNSNRNQVGGTTAAERNISSGNIRQGMVINGGHNTVQGNYIGLGADGKLALSNGLSGVLIQGTTGSFNTIGGTVNGAGNVISANGTYGIFIRLNATRNQIQGNIIGLDATGTNAIPNNSGGVLISNFAFANTIGGTTANERNIISGNGGSAGIIIEDNSNQNLIQGNYIGTDLTGTIDRGNSGHGIRIGGAANNFIGGTAAGAGNVISGNNNSGIVITGDIATGNLVQGNFIGTDATGTAALGNSIDGIVLQGGANANTIGGTTAAARNIISGNGDNGIDIRNAGTSGNLVLGNFIGTDGTGTVALGNNNDGIQIQFNATGNIIGGTATGARNVISGNNLHGIGISDTSSNNQIFGNLIGTDATGSGALGNNGSGVFISGTATGNTIGGTAAGAGNTIAFNGGNGVTVSSAVGNPILGNAIFSNTALGIALVNGGSADQAAPVLTAAVINLAGIINVQGTLTSTPNRIFRIEFFGNMDGDPPSHGRTFLGAVDVATNAAGLATFSAVVMSIVDQPFLTATATDVTANNTSEFSADLHAKFEHVILDNTLGLYVDVKGFQQNAFGGNEKWLRGKVHTFGNFWYFILPDGRFFAWSGVAGNLTGNELAVLSADFHKNAELLYEASDLTLDTDGTNEAQNLDADRGFYVDHRGFYQNAFGGNEKWLRGEVHQFGNFWYFILPDGRFFEWSGTARRLTGFELFDFGTGAVHLKPELIFQASQATLDDINSIFARSLDRVFGLYVDAGGFYQNAFGGNEKWLRGKTHLLDNSWYFILPDGGFFAWDGTPGSLTGISQQLLGLSFFTGVLGAAAHRNPELVYQAADFTIDQTQLDLAFSLDRQHGFHVDHRGFFENTFGEGERWLRGEENSHGNVWYFIQTDGKFFEWSGEAGSLTGTELAAFDEAFHLSPELIHRAFTL